MQRSLAHLSDGTLRQKLASLASTDRATTADLLRHLAEFETRRLHAKDGFPSLFEYCARRLRFSDVRCRLLGTADHVFSVPELTRLPSDVLRLLREVDRFGHCNPRVLRCSVEDSTIIFNLVASIEPGAPPHHVFGAIRFLSGKRSMVQYVQSGYPSKPSETHFAIIRRIVNSFREPSGP